MHDCYKHQTKIVKQFSMSVVTSNTSTYSELRDVRRIIDSSFII